MGFVIAAQETIGGVFCAWEATTRRDEKFDSKWFAIRRKCANHRSKQFDGYNRRKHQNNNLCLMLLGYCLFLSTSYNRLYQISIKNFDRIFSLSKRKKSGANLIIFPEKSAKNLRKISPLLHWPVQEVMQGFRLLHSGSFH